MGYSNFKRLQQVLQKFDLTDIRKPIFDKITPVEPSDRLKQAL